MVKMVNVRVVHHQKKKKKTHAPGPNLKIPGAGT